MAGTVERRRREMKEEGIVGNFCFLFFFLFLQDCGMQKG